MRICTSFFIWVQFQTQEMPISSFIIHCNQLSLGLNNFVAATIFDRKPGLLLSPKPSKPNRAQAPHTIIVTLLWAKTSAGMAS